MVGSAGERQLGGWAGRSDEHRVEVAQLPAGSGGEGKEERRVEGCGEVVGREHGAHPVWIDGRGDHVVCGEGEHSGRAGIGRLEDRHAAVGRRRRPTMRDRREECGEVRP
jgi:hypothetical protein